MLYRIKMDTVTSHSVHSILETLSIHNIYYIAGQVSNQLQPWDIFFHDFSLGAVNWCSVNAGLYLLFYLFLL